MKHSLDAKIKIYIYDALILYENVFLDKKRGWLMFCICNHEAISSHHHQQYIYCKNLLDNTYHFVLNNIQFIRIL